MIFLNLVLKSDMARHTRDFTDNPNIILFKWRSKRKHSPAKCVIRTTETCRMENHLILLFWINQFAEPQKSLTRNFIWEKGLLVAGIERFLQLPRALWPSAYHKIAGSELSFIL